MDNGIPPCFADNQISPLYNHDGHKESCVASVLQLFPVTVCLQKEQYAFKYLLQITVLINQISLTAILSYIIMK
jgi:hypothetical protein